MKKEKKKMNFNLLLLLLGRTISDTGTGIQAVVMPLYIIDAGGSAATVGLFSFLSLMPTLLAYPFAGVLGDRLNRKLISAATDFASAAVILYLAYASHMNKMGLAMLFAVQVIVSVLYGMFDPATKGMLPQLVPEGELTKANSTLASFRILSGLISPVIGAALYASLGVSVLFLINGISFLLSGACSLLIRYKHGRAESVLERTRFIADLSEGFRFIMSNKAISKLCIFFLIIYALIQPMFTVVLPLFFKSSLAYSYTQYGYLQMAMIFGALLGSILVGVLFGKEKNTVKPLIIGSYLQMGTVLAFSAILFPRVISLLGNNTVSYFTLLAGALSLLSIGTMFINVPVQTFIQKATPNEYMSRVFSIVGMISKGGMPFGALIYGLILSRAQVHWTIFAAALTMVAVSAVFVNYFLNMRELNEN